MDWSVLEQHFSRARLERYLAAHSGSTLLAEADYTRNLQLSEAMFPMLNVLEIALRNGIHSRLSIHYGHDDWWQEWHGITDFDWQMDEIERARRKLLRRKEASTPDKLIAELPFGFWSSLFNAQFQLSLWKELRLVFAFCPKAERQRKTISAALNKVRALRNRVFHHEPLIWLNPTLNEQHAIGVQVVNWIDPKLGMWLEKYDRLPDVWERQFLRGR